MNTNIELKHRTLDTKISCQMLSTTTYPPKTIKPLFTLQHSSAAKSNKGNSVTSLCFLQRNNSRTHSEYVEECGHDPHSDDDTFDSEGESSIDELEFKSRRLLSSTTSTNTTISRYTEPTHALPQHNSAVSQATALSFDHTLLASTHVNGLACIWDLTKRRVIKTLDDSDAFPVSEPGLGLGIVNDRHLFHQKRSRNGTVIIYDEEFNAVQRLQCQSQTFCKASSTGGASNNLIITPSKHSSFAQLWDIRVGGKDGTKSVGVIHGARLHREDVSKWRDDGMLTSLKLSTWNGSAFLGCGMESGKVFLHDLRMTGKRKHHSFSSADFVVTKDDVLETDACSAKPGICPILCLDIYPSQDEKKGLAQSNSKSHNAKRSVIVIAGQAADARELMAQPGDERGTVSVIKATTRRKNEALCEMQARIRAKVGTCKLSDEISREGKPGVGVCKFRPDGKIFAVGGWDKRIRLYSRTSAKQLGVLRGLNEQSISSLEWANGDDRIVQEGILAAGSDDGKIAIWRSFPLGMTQT